jgi:hypothetical protein
MVLFLLPGMVGWLGRSYLFELPPEFLKLLSLIFF